MKIIVSYAREDKKWLEGEKYSLIPWLKASLKKQGVDIWYDRVIDPGEIFEERIAREIDKADIAIILISQDFINSDFINDFELPKIEERAKKNELIIVPILVGHCEWESFEFIGKLQILPGEPTPLIAYINNEYQWDKVRAEILSALKKQISKAEKNQEERLSKLKKNGDLNLRKEGRISKVKKVKRPKARKKAVAFAIAAVGLTMIIGLGIYYLYIHGNENWTFKTSDMISSTPTCSKDFLFVTSTDGNIYLLDRITGKEVSRLPTGNKILTSPNLSGNLLFITSRDQLLYGIDISNQNVFCKMSIGERPGSPAVYKGYVYVNSGNGDLTCVDPEKSLIIWGKKVSGGSLTPPVVYENIVYCGSSRNKVFGYDFATGEQVKEIGTLGEVNSPPTFSLSRGYMYITCIYREGGALICYPRNSDKIKWSLEKNETFSAPVVWGDRVFAGCDDGNLYCLDAEDGTMKWSFSGGGGILSPSVTERYIYFGTKENEVYCLNKEGREIITYNTFGPVFSTPIIYGKNIYVACGDGKVYCFNTPEDENGSWPMFKYDPARTGCPQ